MLFFKKNWEFAAVKSVLKYEKKSKSKLYNEEIRACKKYTYHRWSW
jgi:hypothetical protein